MIRFVECDYKEVEKPTRSNLTNLLAAFENRHIKCAKIEDSTYCSPRCGANTINRRAKSLNLFHIKAVVRNGNIYLVNQILNKD